MVPQFRPLAVAFVAIVSAVGLLAGAGGAFAQTGGFVEPATSTAYRAPWSATQIQGFLPARGRFTFPAPYGTVATRLTNATDCGGGDCVNYTGYSYWSNINNHVGSDTMLIVLGLSRSRGGAGPTLFTYNKTTGETRNAGPLFSSTSAYSWATGEGWYFSATRPTALYMNDGARMLRYDVGSRALETVFDVRYVVGRSDVYVWQMHSSADDRVHSATVKNSLTYADLGCVAYREDTGQGTFIPATPGYDECQIDKSGRWLVIKDNIDGRNGEDNRFIDLHTGVEQIFYDENGAAGHSDVGHGYMVAEDNYASQPGAARVWSFSQDLSAPGQGRLIYHLTSWDSGLGHVAHGNARAATALDQQIACSSNATRKALPRVNEIVCYRLDGSLNALVVAPNLTDLNAPGGGSDDYAKQPKGNLDVTGEYFVWTGNAGSNRLDAFVVHVPVARLGAVTSPSTSTPTTTSGSALTWSTLTNLTAKDNGLQKTGGCDGCPDGTAVSTQSISGTGTLDWNAPEAVTLRVVGLSAASGVTTVGDIPHAIRLQAGVAEVREYGVYRTDVRFSAGDAFRIAVDNGVVRYLRNGAVFYSSALPASGALRVHAVFYGMNGVIGSIALQPVSQTTSGAGDTTPPTVSIGSPAAGATVSGTVAVSASASDSAGIAKVELYLDGVLQGSDDAAPYQWSWDTTRTAAGTHVLQAKAFDKSGNVGSSKTVTVSVSNVVNAPVAAISLAVTGYKVKGLQKADLKWSGATATAVDVYRSGARLTTTANDGFFTDPINKNGGGSYRYKVCAAGTATCSPEVTVTF